MIQVIADEVFGGAKSVLLEGLKWRFRNGTGIKVWKEAWLSGEGTHFTPTMTTQI